MSWRLSPKWISRLFWSGLSLGAVLMARPAQSAERIYVTYGIIRRSMPLESLEQYAADGTIDTELDDFTRYVSDEQLEQLRLALTAEAEISEVAIAQFFYTPQGEALLRRLGGLIQTEAGNSGFYALRAALILAASSEDGLTLLNVLRYFPTEGIQVNIAQALEIANTLRQLVNQTNAAVGLIEQRAVVAAANHPLRIPRNYPDPGELGLYDWVRYTRPLKNASRNRPIPVDYYFPVGENAQNSATTPFPAPVVIISHGLGNDRTTYAYLAKHLASHGFVVAIPEHPGSSAEQLQALVSGQVNEVTTAQEFVDRPLDISAVIDDLERRIQIDPTLNEQVDLSRVGVIGQSFGGYTALALAGAQINRNSLAVECAALNESLNLSLLLQCQANRLPATDLFLEDPRIDAAIAINPASSAIFGVDGFRNINVPLMVISGSADTVTPALIEQIRPFTWLDNPDRYLLMIRQATHFSVMGVSEENSEVLQLPATVIGPAPELAQRYANILALLFLQGYLEQDETALSLLNSAFVNRISEAPLPIALVDQLSPVQLKEAITDVEDQPKLAKRHLQ
ncbi:MAG: alpha/beta fold hydrolase [Thainema sp.]